MPMPAGQKKKILAIAHGDRRVQAAAMYDGQRLIMVELRDIIGNPDEWLPKMHEDIAAKVEGGWVVMVEDRTASFSPLATPFNFDAVSEGGRTNLQNCLDWYFDMDARGDIILGPGMERFRITLGGEGGLLDAKHDEKGRVVYHVDWRRFQAGHKALLMCVAGAVMEEPLSERWLKVMTRALAGAKENPNWLKTFHAITKGYDKVRDKDFEARVAQTENRKYV